MCYLIKMEQHGTPGPSSSSSSPSPAGAATLLAGEQEDVLPSSSPSSAHASPEYDVLKEIMGCGIAADAPRCTLSSA